MTTQTCLDLPDAQAAEGAAFSWSAICIARLQKIARSTS
jgi:hypothetical protein